MSMECFNSKIATLTPYLVTMETHIHTIFIENGHKWKNIISGS